MKNNIIEWIKKEFVSRQTFEDYTLFVKDKYRNLDNEIIQLKKKQESSNISNIDLEMFGIKLFRARIVNISKSILISLLTIGMTLYFMMRWFQ